MAYLQIDHVGISFSRGGVTTEVLRDVNLRIEPGEYVSIIGHSGCGKSTLLNIVAGLLRASLGGVLLEGREVNAPGPTGRWCSRTIPSCPGSRSWQPRC